MKIKIGSSGDFVHDLNFVDNNNLREIKEQISEYTFDDFKLTDYIDNKPINYNMLEDIYKDPDILDLSYFDVSTEGIIWSTVKGTYKGARAIKNAGKEGFRQLKKGKMKLQELWRKLKPLIIKSIKLFATKMSNLFNGWRKLDKTYQQLSKDINIVMNQVKTMQGNFNGLSVTLHDLEPAVIKGYCEILKNFDTFLVFLKEEFFNNRFTEPDEIEKKFNEDYKSGIFRSAEQKKQGALQKCVDFMNLGIKNMNQYGELTIPKHIWDKFSEKWFLNKTSRQLRQQMKQDVKSTVDFVKLSIIGAEYPIEFQGNQVDKFRQFCLDSRGGYLTLLASFLNNRVVEKTLVEGAKSIKKETDRKIKDMEEVFKKITNLTNNVRETETQNINQQKDNLNQNDTDRRDTNGSEASIDMSSTVGAVLEAYCATYNDFLMKSSAIYQSIAQGLLAGSYVILQEARTMVDAIKRSASRTV